MAKYIRFTVTPTDGSPYTQWLNTYVVNRAVNPYVGGDIDQGTAPAAFLIGGPSTDTNPSSVTTVGNVFVIPTSSSNAADVAASPRSWWSKALDKMESQPSQVMFIDADGSPASGIAGLSASLQNPAPKTTATKG